MPWIVALLIGVIAAFVNLFIGNRIRISNEKNMQKQLESNEKNLKNQIETSKEIKFLEFRSTISAKNRQEWINELRHTLSEFLSIAMQLTPDSHEEIEKLSYMDQNKYVEKLFYTKCKIELLLNANKEEQKKVLDEVENIARLTVTETKDFTDTYMQVARNKLITCSRNLFDIHWKKIKNLQ